MYWKISFLILFTVFRSSGQSIDCINLNGDSLTLSDQGKSIVILLTNYRCSLCDKDLIEYLRQFDSSIKIHIISRVGNSVIQRFSFKESIQAYNTILNGNICFDIQAENDKKIFVKRFSDGLFKKLKIKNTPSLLLINNGRQRLIDYDKLFSEIFISEKIKQKINDFLM